MGVPTYVLDTWLLGRARVPDLSGGDCHVGLLICTWWAAYCYYCSSSSSSMQAIELQKARPNQEAATSTAKWG